MWQSFFIKKAVADCSATAGLTFTLLAEQRARIATLVPLAVCDELLPTVLATQGEFAELRRVTVAEDVVFTTARILIHDRGKSRLDGDDFLLRVPSEVSARAMVVGSDAEHGLRFESPSHTLPALDRRPRDGAGEVRMGLDRGLAEENDTLTRHRLHFSLLERDGDIALTTHRQSATLTDVAEDFPRIAILRKEECRAGHVFDLRSHNVSNVQGRNGFIHNTPFLS